uniref:F-box domain-containing protein n=1 Tax=Oryza brachyantha TaxID=4533 RepID=J3MYU1_ORYBR
MPLKLVTLISKKTFVNLYISANNQDFICNLCSLFVSLMTDRNGPICRLPEHLLVEIFIRLPICEWVQISCVSKQWASMFQGECVWQTAIARNWPSAGLRKRWPGPIPRGSARRRFQALYVSENLVSSSGDIDELVGHTYLYLKEQLERPAIPPSSILHGTIIDQFIACGRTGEKAHELASKIWLAVIDNLEENQQTFLLLKHLAQEGEFFLPFPYSRSYKVLWRVFDKLFTDLRDCFSRVDYHDALAGAKSRFQPVPSTWLGH